MRISKEVLKKKGWTLTADGASYDVYSANGLECIAKLYLLPPGYWLEIHGLYSLIVSGAVDSFADIEELKKYAKRIIHSRGIV